MDVEFDVTRLRRFKNLFPLLLFCILVVVARGCASLNFRDDLPAQFLEPGSLVFLRDGAIPVARFPWRKYVYEGEKSRDFDGFSAKSAFLLFEIKIGSIDETAEEFSL